MIFLVQIIIGGILTYCIIKGWADYKKDYGGGIGANGTSYNSHRSTDPFYWMIMGDNHGHEQNDNNDYHSSDNYNDDNYDNDYYDNNHYDDNYYDDNYYSDSGDNQIDF